MFSLKDGRLKYFHFILEEEWETDWPPDCVLASRWLSGEKSNSRLSKKTRTIINRRGHFSFSPILDKTTDLRQSLEVDLKLLIFFQRDTHELRDCIDRASDQLFKQFVDFQTNCSDAVFPKAKVNTARFKNVSSHKSMCTMCPKIRLLDRFPNQRHGSSPFVCFRWSKVCSTIAND